jgi:hypothetical protein
MALVSVKVLIETVSSVIPLATLAEGGRGWQSFGRGVEGCRGEQKWAEMCRAGQRWAKRKIERDQQVDERNEKI